MHGTRESRMWQTAWMNESQEWGKRLKWANEWDRKSNIERDRPIKPNADEAMSWAICHFYAIIIGVYWHDSLLLWLVVVIQW